MMGIGIRIFRADDLKTPDKTFEVQLLTPTDDVIDTTLVTITNDGGK